MRQTIILALAVVLGCSVGDPPCPPGARYASLAEADDAFGRRSVREVSEGRGEDVGAMYRCIDLGNGRTGDATVTFADVVECAGIVVQRAAINRPISLSSCLSKLAKDGFMGWTSPEDRASTLDGLRTATSAFSNADCVEKYRAVDVEAEPHGLNRMGPEEWVPAVLWLILQGADKAMTPATGPAMFLIKPDAGLEEACVDLPAQPAKRCADEDGCPDRPDGAEDVGGVTTGDVLPPGTEPPPPGDGI